MGHVTVPDPAPRWAPPAAGPAGGGGCTAAAALPAGVVEEINIGVRARLVEDAGTVEAVTRAYAAKYGDSPYVGALLTEEAADATLRLALRP